MVVLLFLFAIIFGALSSTAPPLPSQAALIIEPMGGLVEELDGDPYDRAIEELLGDEAERLTRKAIELAIAGDTTALRLCLERLCPPAKDRPIKVDLPVLTTASDAVAAMGKVLEHISKGEITPDEGQVLANLIERLRRTVETADLEHRIATLENEFGSS